MPPRDWLGSQRFGGPRPGWRPMASRAGDRTRKPLLLLAAGVRPLHPLSRRRAGRGGRGHARWWGQLHPAVLEAVGMLGAAAVPGCGCCPGSRWRLLQDRVRRSHVGLLPTGCGGGFSFWVSHPCSLAEDSCPARRECKPGLDLGRSGHSVPARPHGASFSLEALSEDSFELHSSSF